MSRKSRVATVIQSYGEGALLRALRLDSGISLTEMSVRISYHKSFLSAIETGTEKASKGVIEGYEKQLRLMPGELQDRIDALRTKSPARVIELLSNNWLPWLQPLLNELSTPSSDKPAVKEGISGYGQDVEKYRRSIELALKNAAEGLLGRSEGLEEINHCLNVLTVLSEAGGRGSVLRMGALRNFFASLPSLNGQELIDNTHQHLPEIVGEEASVSLLPLREEEESRYLRDFVAALLSELYVDPLFRSRMKKELREYLARIPRKSSTEIVAMLSQVYEMLELRYTPEHLESQMKVYVTYIEGVFRYVYLRSFTPKENQPATPRLSDIFVSPYVTELEPNLPTPAQVKTEPPMTTVTFLQDSIYGVLLGGPGTGKSTITHYLAWSHATAQEDNVIDRKPSLLPGNPLPLHIELRPFIEHWKLQDKDIEQLRYDDFLIYAAELCTVEKDQRISTYMFRHLLERRRMVILLDGLDEVPELRERQKLVAVIENFARHYPGNFILVTSRPVGYPLVHFSDQSFKPVEVQAFSETQIQEYVTQLYRYLLQRPVLLETDKQGIDALLKRLKEPGLYRLAENPLLLMVIVMQSRAYGIADKRGEAYEACAQLLLFKWAGLKGTDKRWKGLLLDNEDTYDCTAHLGFVLHEQAQDGGKQPLTVDVPAAFLQEKVEVFLRERDRLAGPEERREQAALFLELIQVETGLIVERGTGEKGERLYGFIHRTFQEYFAAVSVYNKYEQEENPQELEKFIDPHLHKAHWREVILLLLARLSRRPVTIRLREILKGNSPHNNILKHDLFFVVDCLVDEIMVEEALAMEVVADLRDVIRSSPFYSQRREAMTYLVSLMRTRQHASLAQRTLASCIAEDIPKQERLCAAESLYEYAPSDLPGQRQAFQALAQSAQQPERSSYYTVMFLYQHSSEGSLYRRQTLDMLLSFAQHPQLTIEQLWDYASFLLLPIPADTSISWQQDVQLILLQLVNHPNLSTQQRVELIKRLCGQSFDMPALWSLNYQMLEDLERFAQATINDVVQIAHILYQRTRNFSSPEQPEVHLLVQQKLRKLLVHPDLPIEEKLQIAETFLWSNEVELRHEALQLCQRLTRGRELPQAATQILLSITERLYRSPERVQERRQAFQMLTKLLRWRGINLGEIVNFAWTLYRFNENDDDQCTRAISIFSEVATRKHAPIEQLLSIADAIHAAHMPRPEPKYSALSILANLLERNTTLSTPQLLRITELLGNRIDNGDAWQYFEQALMLLLQRSDMTSGHLAQLTRDYRPDVPHLRRRVLQYFVDLIKNQDLEKTIRLNIVIPILEEYDVSYQYKIAAVQTVVALLQSEPAKQFLQQHWRAPLSETGDDIPSMLELVQQDLLPEFDRDRIYVELRRMIVQTGATIHDSLSP
jgi:NACHT domain